MSDRVMRAQVLIDGDPKGLRAALAESESDLLKHETALAMAERGPRARLVEIAGVGHAPTFMDEAQIAIVRDFLLG